MSVWPMQAGLEGQHIRGRTGGWILAPEDVHVQDLKACAWYLVAGKRDSIDVITLRSLRRGGDPGLSGWALSEITSAFLRGRQDRISLQRRQCEDTEQRLEQRWEGCGHKPRNASSPQKLEESKNRFSPGASPKRASSADTLTFTTYDLLWTCDFQNY